MNNQENLVHLIEGKTKILESYIDEKIDYKNLVKITTKNVLTANDALKKDDVGVASYKTNQTCSIFRFLEDNNIPTSFVKQLDSFSFVAKQCKMLPYECVIRRKAYGSFLKRYPNVEEATKFYIPHVEFFHKYALIPTVLSHEDSNAITDIPKLIPEEQARKFYLKNGEWTVPVETDPLLVWNFGEWRDKNQDNESKIGFKYDLYSAKKPTEEKLLQIDSIINVREYLEIMELIKSVFHLLEKRFNDFDIELIDLKLEVGYDFDHGKLIIGDVIDNDSWRIWPMGDKNNQLDKQAYRDGDSLDNIISNYKKVSDIVKMF